MVIHLVLLINIKAGTQINMLDRLLSLVIAFTTILILCYLILLTTDLNDLWSIINDYKQIIEYQNKKIRDLQILVLTKKGFIT